jgi:hypothetical protein
MDGLATGLPSVPRPRHSRLRRLVVQYKFARRGKRVRGTARPTHRRTASADPPANAMAVSSALAYRLGSLGFWTISFCLRPISENALLQRKVVVEIAIRPPTSHTVATRDIDHSNRKSGLGPDSGVVIEGVCACVLVLCAQGKEVIDTARKSRAPIPGNPRLPRQRSALIKLGRATSSQAGPLLS